MLARMTQVQLRILCDLWWNQEPPEEIEAFIWSHPNYSIFCKSHSFGSTDSWVLCLMMTLLLILFFNSFRCSAGVQDCSFGLDMDERTLFWLHHFALKGEKPQPCKTKRKVCQHLPSISWTQMTSSPDISNSTQWWSWRQRIYEEIQQFLLL